MSASVTGSLELEAFYDAAFAEARRVSPHLNFAFAAEGHFPPLDASAGWSLVTASVGLGLALRPTSIAIHVRAAPAEGTATVEILSEGVAQEAPSTTEEWRRVERSLATIEKLDGTFECRWLADTRKYTFVVVVPLRRLRATRLQFE